MTVKPRVRVACRRQMVDNVIVLGNERSDRTGDNGDWAPADCLRWHLLEIEAGRLSPDALVVAYRYEENGRTKVKACSVNLTYQERAGIFALLAMDYLRKDATG